MEVRTELVTTDMIQQLVKNQPVSYKGHLNDDKFIVRYFANDDCDGYTDDSLGFEILSEETLPFVDLNLQQLVNENALFEGALSQQADTLLGNEILQLIKEKDTDDVVLNYLRERELVVNSLYESWQLEPVVDDGVDIFTLMLNGKKSFLHYMKENIYHHCGKYLLENCFSELLDESPELTDDVRAAFLVPVVTHCIEAGFWENERYGRYYENCAFVEKNRSGHLSVIHPNFLDLEQKYELIRLEHVSDYLIQLYTLADVEFDDQFYYPKWRYEHCVSEHLSDKLEINSADTRTMIKNLYERLVSSGCINAEDVRIGRMNATFHAANQITDSHNAYMDGEVYELRQAEFYMKNGQWICIEDEPVCGGYILDFPESELDLQ